MNLNEDPLLNGKIIYPLQTLITYVGRKNGDPTPDIILGGLGILSNHAVFYNEEGVIFIEPASSECHEFIHLNGEKVTEKKMVK